MQKPYRTTQGGILRRSAKCEQKLAMILFYDAPDTDEFMETSLVEVIDSIVAVVNVFVYSVVKCVGAWGYSR